MDSEVGNQNVSSSPDAGRSIGSQAGTNRILEDISDAFAWIRSEGADLAIW